MPVECDLLFVYGTLRSDSVGSTGRAQRDRLTKAATILGPATVPGLLYNLGQYPGLVVPGDASVGLVRGEIWRLSPPHQRLLQWLDQYEGIVPGHSHNEYERRKVDAVLDDGQTVRAWTYVYLQTVAASALIRSGDWLAR